MILVVILAVLSVGFEYSVGAECSGEIAHSVEVARSAGVLPTAARSVAGRAGLVVEVLFCPI